MAKPNYDFAKRQREMAKKEEKLRKKQGSADEALADDAPTGEAAPPTAGETKPAV